MQNVPNVTFIYALCEPGTRTIRYIGKSNDPTQRLRTHLSVSAKRRNTLGIWLQHVAVNGVKPNLIILREVPYTTWKEAERRYIRIARGLGMVLLNSTDGGEGYTPSPEIRAKMSLAACNRSEETRAKLSKAARARRHTPETRVKISLANKGKMPSPENLARLIASSRGRKPSFASRSKMRAAKLGVRLSPEIRSKISIALRGFKNPFFGRRHSEITKAKIRARRLATQSV